MKKNIIYFDGLTLGTGIHIDTEVKNSMGNEIGTAGNVMLSINYKTLRFTSLADEEYWIKHEMHQSIEQAKQKILTELTKHWHDDNEIIGFHIEPIGRALTEKEKAEIEEFKQECNRINTESNRKKNELEIQALESRIRQLRSGHF